MERNEYMADFSAYMSNYMMKMGENGEWPFSAGNPEYWKFRDRLIVPGGRVLDLGISDGRSSSFFSLHGMRVEGIDRDMNGIFAVNTLHDVLNTRIPLINTGEEVDIFPMYATDGDVRASDFGEDVYDVALADQLFIHFESKKDAMEVLNNAYKSLKKGGHLWVRAMGKLDSQYQEMVKVGTGDEEVVYDYCACSGNVQFEPHLFFDPHVLVEFAVSHNMGVVDSQHGTTRGKANIMYGEDYPNPSMHNPDREAGFITLLAQKR